MDVSFHIVRFDWPGGSDAIPDTLAAVARAAEESGAVGLSVMDHYFQIDIVGKPEDPMLEGYTTLGFLAALTSRIRLGMLVTGVTYRHPALLAKIVTTLDVLSRGRAQLGIGAAWYEHEHRALGVPFPGIGERIARLDETLAIVRQMWSGEEGAFRGKHYSLERTLDSPRSIQRPHPPILVGGQGERKLLKVVARHADACNLFTGDGPKGVQHKLSVLRAHCESEGRDYDAIRKTILFMRPPREDLGAFVADMRAYAEIGIEEVVLMPSADDPAAEIRALAPTIEQLANLHADVTLTAPRF